MKFKQNTKITGELNVIKNNNNNKRHKPQDWHNTSTETYLYY